MNKWGYDEMSDSQVMIGALLQIMNELRINTDLRKELAKRFAEDRSHVPLSKRTAFDHAMELKRERTSYFCDHLWVYHPNAPRRCKLCGYQEWKSLHEPPST